MAYSRIFLLGAAVALIVPGDVTAQLCSLCECPALYAPVCGFRSIGREFRTFSSMCVLSCTNKCEKYKYRFVVDGRCSTYLATSTTSTTTTTTTTTTAPPEAFSVLAEEPTTTNPLILEDTEIPEIAPEHFPQTNVPQEAEVQEPGDVQQEEQYDVQQHQQTDVQQQATGREEIESLASLWARIATI